MSSSGKDIMAVFPTAMHKQVMKARLKVAQKGHDILKRKAEVLEMRYIVGDFNHLVLSAVCKARLKVKHKTENVAGVNLKIFEFYVEGGDAHDLAGLAKGGAKLLSIKQTFTNAVEILVELATLQTTFKMLDEVIKSLNRRVNSLEQLYIPKVERTIHYIETEMDEGQRQDFFRLKKIQNIKKKDIERRMKDKEIFDVSKEVKKSNSK
ncbi:v-type proton ATPase subunit D [Caerostris extrusa]|uniref:V-type proton ATPase subunit D n=1 Tax=Caerostris extrusa TaxID=172846 RepID=A0AAV4N244_CAEEX|nr:v-type proton ATPase subunit D [Caerostris extrusa]